MTSGELLQRVDPKAPASPGRVDVTAFMPGTDLAVTPDPAGSDGSIPADQAQTWDARGWLATLAGCERSELAVRSIDHYGPGETQVRYERGDVAIARLVVAGPIVKMGDVDHQGHWLVSVRIGSGSEDAHTAEVPVTGKIVY